MSSPPDYSSPVLHVGCTQHALPQAHNAATSLSFISVVKPGVVALRRCACSYSCFEGALLALLEERQRDSGAVQKVATNHAYSIVVATIWACSSSRWLRLLQDLLINIQQFCAMCCRNSQLSVTRWLACSVVQCCSPPYCKVEIWKFFQASTLWENVQAAHSTDV